MKKTSKKTKQQPQVKKYPVPEWMDNDLKPTAETLDVLQRHALADKLERQALQLREMKSPTIQCVVNASVPLRPNVKRAILAFYKRWSCGRTENEAEMLSQGIRWYLEAGLTLIRQVDVITKRDVNYCKAEGICQCEFSENAIGDALNKWQSELAETDDSED